MAKYTQGPWELEQSNTWPFYLLIKVAGKAREITTLNRLAHSTRQKTLRDCRDAVGFRGDEAEQVRAEVAEQEANARLMAAAPDLLEACKKANTCASLPDAVRELCRAAVRKAEGK